jgi:hypothetical protein
MLLKSSAVSEITGGENNDLYISHSDAALIFNPSHKYSVWMFTELQQVIA